jgi:citronellol/citronellal dehydrogenase
VTKYGMSMLTMGMSEEFTNYGISVNSLWPQTMIATAAIEFQLGSRESFKHARTPAIMADAAHVILSSSDRKISGRLLIDEEILRESGVTEFDHYRFEPDSSAALMTDLFVD